MADPRALLEWYAAMGADELIGDVPADRFAAPPPPAVATPARAAEPGQGAIHDAVAAADACQTMAELAAAIRAYDGCALKRTATHTVVYDGVLDGELMLVGEAPGAEEDRQGLPFVGPAGHMLDRMLGSIGLSRTEETLITNVIFWRPPGNRTPTPDEIAHCLPFVERAVVLVQPSVLVFVGGIAAKAMMGRTEGITRLRGHWYKYQCRGLAAPINATAIFHPAYLLRQPAQKRETWRDLLGIRDKLYPLRKA